MSDGNDQAHLTVETARTFRRRVNELLSELALVQGWLGDLDPPLVPTDEAGWQAAPPPPDKAARLVPTAVYIPEEQARTALGITRAINHGDIEGARILWDTAEHLDLVGLGLAVLLANTIDLMSDKLGLSPELIFDSMQQGIEATLDGADAHEASAWWLND
jgi:hypothetical protein